MKTGSSEDKDKDFPALTLKGRSFSENVNNISTFSKKQTISPMNDKRLLNVNKDLNNVKDPPTPNSRRRNSVNTNRDHNVPIIKVNAAAKRGRTHTSNTIDFAETFIKVTEESIPE